MHAPKVSIGLMIYNEIQYIEKTLHNILNQSFIDYELLIGDNSSNDGSTELIAQYARNDPRITHIIRPKNIGALQNWNDLVMRANGEYFVLAAAHDLWTSDYLKFLSEGLDKNPNTVLTFAKTQWKDKKGENLSLPVSLLDTSGMSRVSRFVSLIFANQHYMYGMARVSAMKRTRLQKEIIGSGEIYLQELAQVGDFLLIENQRWFRVKNRSDENITETMSRYLRILFSSNYYRFRFKTFPNAQLFFHYLILPFILRGLGIQERLTLLSVYPLLAVRFFKPILRDFKWLIVSRRMC